MKVEATIIVLKIKHCTLWQRRIQLIIHFHNLYQVISFIYSFDIIISENTQTHSKVLLPCSRTKYCNITLNMWCCYCQSWINIMYWRPTGICFYVNSLALAKNHLWSPFLYKSNSLVHSMCTTLDISSDLHVFVFQYIFQSKSIVLFVEIFVG